MTKKLPQSQQDDLLTGDKKKIEVPVEKMEIEVADSDVEESARSKESKMEVKQEVGRRLTLHLDKEEPKALTLGVASEIGATKYNGAQDNYNYLTDDWVFQEQMKEYQQPAVNNIPQQRTQASDKTTTKRSSANYDDDVFDNLASKFELMPRQTSQTVTKTTTTTTNTKPNTTPPALAPVSTNTSSYWLQAKTAVQKLDIQKSASPHYAREAQKSRSERGHRKMTTSKGKELMKRAKTGNTGVKLNRPVSLIIILS